MLPGVQAFAFSHFQLVPPCLHRYAAATSLDDVIDRSVAPHDDIPLVFLGSGGHELTIMHGGGVVQVESSCDP